MTDSDLRQALAELADEWRDVDDGDWAAALTHRHHAEVLTDLLAAHPAADLSESGSVVPSETTGSRPAPEPAVDNTPIPWAVTGLLGDPEVARWVNRVTGRSAAREPAGDERADSTRESSGTSASADDVEALVLGALIQWAGDAADLNDCREAARHVASRLASVTTPGWRPPALDPEVQRCSACGHSLPHDPAFGCMDEVGDAGSGSVADAVFCKCTAPAREGDTGDVTLSDAERKNLLDAGDGLLAGGRDAALVRVVERIIATRMAEQDELVAHYSTEATRHLYDLKAAEARVAEVERERDEWREIASRSDAQAEEATQLAESLDRRVKAAETERDSLRAAWDTHDTDCAATASELAALRERIEGLIDAESITVHTGCCGPGEECAGGEYVPVPALRVTLGEAGGDRG